jgi:hypothetical protein
MPRHAQRPKWAPTLKIRAAIVVQKLVAELAEILKFEHAMREDHRIRPTSRLVANAWS